MISELKQDIDIVSIIEGSGVVLKRQGRHDVGLCPFHDDTTPSFTVNPDMQIYKCFSCGEGGNVFTFLVKHEKMDFPEAVRFLAEKCNVTIAEATEADKERGAFKNDLLKLNHAAFLLSSRFDPNILISNFLF